MAPTVPAAPAVAAFAVAAGSRACEAGSRVRVVASTTRVTGVVDSDAAQSDAAREEGAFETLPNKKQ